MKILRATASDPASLFLQIADIHIQEIQHAALPLLGRRFIASMYRGIATAPGGSVWVALENGTPVGFVAGSSDTKRTYRSAILRRGAAMFLFACFGILRRPSVIKKLLPLFRYIGGGQPAVQSGPRAELLAIAVSSMIHHRGVGRGLVTELESELCRLQVHEYFVIADTQEVVSNQFYRGLGFEAVATYPLHQLVVQEYRRTIAPAA